jgi:hypothetical protein
LFVNPGNVGGAPVYPVCDEHGPVACGRSNAPAGDRVVVTPIKAMLASTANDATSRVDLEFSDLIALLGCVVL